MEMNANIPNLNYMAGLYTYAGGKGKEFLTPYYPMKRYNKGEFGQAIDKLPDIGKGATYLQDGMRELGDILARLSGRTVVFLFTDGTYSLCCHQQRYGAGGETDGSKCCFPQ